MEINFQNFCGVQYHKAPFKNDLFMAFGIKYIRHKVLTYITKNCMIGILIV